MGNDEDLRDRVTRLEERHANLAKDVDSLSKKGWGIVALVLAFVGNKVLALLGMGQ